MKKMLLLLTLFIQIAAAPVLAVTATPSPSANPTSEKVTEKLSDQINNLKEKIASRVAQLKLVEKKGILGSIKEVSGTQITITDTLGTNHLIDVDEITKFSSPSAKDTFGLSDLKPGMKISVIGLYNKDSQRLLARFVNSISLPLIIKGAVSIVDKENYTITVAMEDGKSYLVDIENLTKTIVFNGTDQEKSGFSKIEKWQRVIIIGYPDKKEKNRLVATRILIFPTLPRNPKVVIAPNAVNTDEEVVTSTGSGKKLTPLKQ